MTNSIRANALTRTLALPHAPLVVVLLAALALRVLLWGHVPRTGLISDEGEYLSAASWLAEGRGFSWYNGYLWTRAPIYPLFVAAHLRLFGDTLAPIYVTQTILSLASVALVYALARRATNDERRTTNDQARNAAFIQNRVPTIAAALMAIYFPFALYAQVLLSETLFITLLLGAFLALAVWSDEGRRTKDEQPERHPWSLVLGPWSLVSGRWSLVVAGVLLGLATLTRSLTLAFLPIAALWVAWSARGSVGRGLRSAAILLICTGAIVLPWTLYNSLRLYGGLVAVDTTGAFNLLLGARTAYDGNRNDAATRDYVLVLLGQKLAADVALQPCLPYPEPPPGSQAARQSAMTAEALCLIRAKPLAFAQKSLAELVDLFQINYGGDERFADGFAGGRLPRWYSVGLFLLDDTIYVLALPLAVIGWGLARRRTTDDQRPKTKDQRLKLLSRPWSLVVRPWSLVELIGLWWLFNIAVAPLLFAINRFRLPLLPFAFIFAAYALLALGHGGWWRIRWGYAALAVLLLLVAATPYAYFEPRASGDSRWASYLGPYPSSLESTIIAWRRRPGELAEQPVKAALGRGDAGEARRLIESSDVNSHTLRLARPLLAGLEGRPDDSLAMLPPLDAIVVTKDVEMAVVRGDLLRRKGDMDGARFIFGQTFVDNENPVQFAWDWLRPPPLPDNRIDLAGNLDLGYVEGCYLGEGDREAQGNFRWCSDGARLRFPGAGTGAPQTLTLRVDGRAWASFAGAAPPVSVLANGQPAGQFTADTAGVREFSVALPPTPNGADVVITLRTETFVAPAERYLSQQGRAVVGQVQRLGARLDWAELRERAP